MVIGEQSGITDNEIIFDIIIILLQATPERNGRVLGKHKLYWFFHQLLIYLVGNLKCEALISISLRFIKVRSADPASHRSAFNFLSGSGSGSRKKKMLRKTEKCKICIEKTAGPGSAISIFHFHNCKTTVARFRHVFA